jgi:hypothetical protein
LHIRHELVRLWSAIISGSVEIHHFAPFLN